ncbi:MAG: segregation/condensation protein A [Deltaproteobacteria bacterium]|jgi:segregation and condensation protein A|nr:segregation/condensation protein A [Deltaproteobacteria bacterium]
MGYEIKLDIFEGPLDLLLFLIKKNEIDIYNIPIALITEQYLEYLDKMRSLNLDLAGEYLLLAATLLHIKSKTLLPVEEDDHDEDEPDPRAELVRQLLEYQIYKEAASQLDTRPLLDRDVFTRSVMAEALSDQDDQEMAIELSVFDLVDAFYKIVSTMEKGELLEIDMEKMSLAERMNEIMDNLAEKRNLTFMELLGEHANRRMLIYTFLAILELMRQRMIRIYQASSFGVIRVRLAVES